MISKIKTYLKLMRCHHYIKNLLILLPVIFAGQLFELSILGKAIIGIIAYSFVSSIVYIINDIVDVESDRQHEKKKHRPIASGAVSIKNASILAILLLVVSIILNISIHANIYAYVYIYGYLLLNIGYTLWWKHIPIVDIFILSMGFLIRVLYGAAITSITVSNWLYLTILAFSFYMGLGKRRNEYIKSGSKSRKVLEYYNKGFLDNNMYMCMGLGIVFYSLWCIDVNTLVRTPINLIWTIPIIIVICMRYSLIVEGNSLGDPVDVILGDKALLVLLLLYAIIIFTMLYLI